MPGRTDVDICNLALLYAGVNQKIGALDEVGSATAQACNTAYTEKRRNLFSSFRWPFTIKRKQLQPYFGNLYDLTQSYNAADMAQFGANVYRSKLGANLNHQPDLDASAAWWDQVTRDGYAFACPLPDDCLDPIEAWPKNSVSGLSTTQAYNFKDPTSFNLRNPRASQRAPFKLENANDGTDLEILLTDVNSPILMYTADVNTPAAFPAEFVEALAWHMAVPLAAGLRNDDKKVEFCVKMAQIKEGEAFVVSMRDQREDQQPVSEFEAARQGGG